MLLDFLLVVLVILIFINAAVLVADMFDDDTVDSGVTRVKRYTFRRASFKKGCLKDSIIDSTSVTTSHHFKRIVATKIKRSNDVKIEIRRSGTLKVYLKSKIASVLKKNGEAFMIVKYKSGISHYYRWTLEDSRNGYCDKISHYQSLSRTMIDNNLPCFSSSRSVYDLVSYIAFFDSEEGRSINICS